MFIKYLNSQIHAKTYGKGDTIVLLHGFLLSSSIWKDLIPELSKKNKVVTIDLPGHGLSECISDIHSMELMAEVVLFVLKELKIEKASFIGHSMGGYISLAFAEKYPSKIETLVLLNSTTLPDSPERIKNRKRAIKVVENNAEIFIKMAIRALFHERDQKKYSSEIKTLINNACHFPIKGIIAAINGMKNRKERTSVLKSFKGKKYMICGEKDPIIAFTETKKVANYSKTTLIKVKSGHMSLTENIDEIVKIVHFIDFL